MESVYGSIQDRRAARSQEQPVPPALEKTREKGQVRRSLKLRATHGVGIAIVLGALLLGFVLGSNGGGRRDDTGAAGAAGAAAANFWDKGILTEMEEEPVCLLSLQARNEYGEFDALGLYSLDMLVEPYKESILSVSGRTGNATTEREEKERSRPKLSTGVDGRRSIHEIPLETARTKLHWLLIPLDENGEAVQSAPAILDVVTDGGGGVGSGRVDGPAITLTEAGSLSLLTVTETLEDGRVVGEGRATVACRYVRRELRSLTEEDREAYMDAMVNFYTAPGGNGTESGSMVTDNYQYWVEVHNSNTFCYHHGMMFLTAHLAFDLVVERALQRFNPAVSLAFWDFTIETDILGADWPQSMMFGPDMFGSALGSPDNGFMVSDGRFSNVSSIYDPESLLVAPVIAPGHNPYGYINAPYDHQDVPKLSRTHSFCGFTGTSAFASCEEIIDCFEEDTFHLWSKCLEVNIHADMHYWLGGAWGCKVNMDEFQSEHPVYTDDLLVFVLLFVTANQWPSNGLFSDYNVCDASCEKGSDAPCGCTCLIDPDTMTDDEVYAATQTALVGLTTMYRADIFMSFDSSKPYAYNFVQDGVPLENDELFLLLRYIIKVGCEPANVGAMTSGPSPLDPIFWTLHPLFERALHLLWLSPKYNEKFDFIWYDEQCYGSGLTDMLPFSRRDLGQGNDTAYLTNEDLLQIAHPDNRKLPYVYENFKAWGTCTISGV